jgi:replicative DNA helicase
MSRAMGVLNEMPIYLDDVGALTVGDVRSRCRRLKSTVGLGAIFVDYLQLLRPSVLSRNANRNEELSEISRSLKVTAKELSVPIIALAQLNRGVEARQEKRPMLADLRDCLAAGALVTNADTGERVRVSDIVANRLRFSVWAVDKQLKLVRRPIVDAWEVGERQVFRVTARSGRTIRCTDGHRFMTTGGWRELKTLQKGDSIAGPRHYPAPVWASERMTQGVREKRNDAAHYDRIPLESNVHVRELRLAQRLSHATLGWRDQGKRMSRATCAMVAERLDDEELAILANSDVVWEEIASIAPEGTETVYDLTVGELHNFCVDGFVTHNSGALEQEADVVAFLYRDGYYNPETQDPDLTEFIISKHRNGPTGTVKLRFQREYTLFLPNGDETHYPSP